jgi:ADP-ribosylglycohydrolase
MAIWMARTISQKPNHTPESIKKAIKNSVSEIYGYDLNRTIDDIIKSGYRFNETCQGSVPEAIIAVLESTDFESAIRNAIRLRGDADTQACIAGAIAEVIYGIPEEFKQVVKDKLDPFLLNIVEEFNKKYE